MAFELPLLLLAGSPRALIDRVRVEPARQGHPDARPTHGFAMQAIGLDGASAGDLGRMLGVSKRAAGQTVDRLQELGYAECVEDPVDGRRKLIRLTPHDIDALARSAIAFDKLRAEWAATLGVNRLADLEDALRTMAGSTELNVDTVSWFGTLHALPPLVASQTPSVRATPDDPKARAVESAAACPR
jgi:DNA-binding MarR family transcriptional regulator